MKKLRYLKMGKDSTVGLRIKTIPEMLFICSDGENHKESFKTLSEILASIFSREVLKNPLPARENTDKGNYQIIEVMQANFGKQRCALFLCKEKGESLLVRREKASSGLIREWIKQVKYYLP